MRVFLKMYAIITFCQTESRCSSTQHSSRVIFTSINQEYFVILYNSGGIENICPLPSNYFIINWIVKLERRISFQYRVFLWLIKIFESKFNGLLRETNGDRSNTRYRCNKYLHHLKSF